MDATETSLEDQRQRALKHYEELSNASAHWSSFVRDAILSYTPEKHNGWIKTSDQKPKLNEPVLVWCEIYGRFIATYEDIGAGEDWGNWRNSSGRLGILPPIYWMPLPKPPNHNH